MYCTCSYVHLINRLLALLLLLLLLLLLYGFLTRHSAHSTRRMHSVIITAAPAWGLRDRVYRVRLSPLTITSDVFPHYLWEGGNVMLS